MTTTGSALIARSVISDFFGCTPVSHVAPARAEGRTLFNTMAQQQARDLLASADDYF